MPSVCLLEDSAVVWGIPPAGADVPPINRSPSFAINAFSVLARRLRLESATDRVKWRISATRSATRSADRIAKKRSDLCDPDRGTGYGQAELATDIRANDLYTIRALSTRRRPNSRSLSSAEPSDLSLLHHHHHHCPPSLPRSLLPASLAAIASIRRDFKSRLVTESTLSRSVIERLQVVSASSVVSSRQTATWTIAVLLNDGSNDTKTRRMPLQRPRTTRLAVARATTP
ncbi:hypothetical protein BDZ89DRAFT_1051120 [Hymenopellis radicata]|nr:hypothetical protein BDZ89DRAFT_1051120 [Hymenopellis radicata]